MKDKLDTLKVKPLSKLEQKAYSGGVIGIVLAVIALALTTTTAVGYTVGRLTRED
ncbi:MAG: hypothetical protein N4A71_08285 [Carboxylicivirga sp.]|jgi:hypothetical protein|nr:hypothetical protein [Carboxylicivirga sp.]